MPKWPCDDHKVYCAHDNLMIKFLGEKMGIPEASEGLLTELSLVDRERKTQPIGELLDTR